MAHFERDGAEFRGGNVDAGVYDPFWMGHKARGQSPGTVEEYFAKAAPWQRGLVTQLRSLVKKSVPSAKLIMKWGAPVYTLREPFAYLGCFSHSVNLGFLHGAALRDPKGLLRGSGKDGRHVPITESQSLDAPALRALLVQAAKRAE
jgi:hypothetical protein